MPRQARLDAPGTLHHVILRGLERGRIVADEEDREAFVARLGEVAAATGTRLYAWALLPNHAHLWMGDVAKLSKLRESPPGYAATSSLGCSSALRPESAFRSSRGIFDRLLHHVMVRGIERRPIGRDDADRAAFVARLAALADRGALAVYAWALLPNHAHLLVRTGTRPLARCMRSLLTGYAGAFNRRHRRVGPWSRTGTRRSWWRKSPTWWSWSATST